MEEIIKGSRTVYVIVGILIVGNIFFGIQYLSVQKELREAQVALEVQNVNEEVLEFAEFFVEEVLNAKGEVDFDTRLKLETAVRDIGDESILSQWQRFVDSQTEFEAQQNVKKLLDILINKIQTTGN